VFGGNTGAEPVNDVWCLNVDKAPFSWLRLECPGEMPNTRVYHSAALCSMGSATGMMVIFGGRTGDQGAALKDTWGLRRHRDGRWDWIKAPYKSNGEEPLARYQHSTIFIGTLMIVLGGRTNTVGENVFMEVYETENSEWKRFNSVQRFRHTIWAVDQTIYMHGGFENETPNIPTNSIMKLDLIQHVKGNAHLMGKLESAFAKLGSSSSKLPTDSTSSNSNNSSRATTPPMQSLAKANMKIRMGRGEIENKKGQAPQIVNFPGSEPKEKNGKNVDSLHQLFLNHLLRPKEWSASVDG
jgi:protein phosphatase